MSFVEHHAADSESPFVASLMPGAVWYDAAVSLSPVGRSRMMCPVLLFVWPLGVIPTPIPLTVNGAEYCLALQPSANLFALLEAGLFPAWLVCGTLQFNRGDAGV